jgi:drug/metabolite transporter superfamily protein YnfA
MKIAEEQNSEENIKRLAGQRNLYSKAKKIRYFKHIGALILIIFSPILVLCLPNSTKILGIIGGIFIILSFLFNFLELKMIKTAANIQEQFDTNLFEIIWNEILCKNKVPTEIITKESREFKGDRKKLLNWYGNIGEIPYPFNVLVCQRSSLVWDWRLRRKFAFWLIIGLSTLIILGISIGIIKKLTLSGYLIGILIPSLSALIFGIKEIYENYVIANDKEELMRIINSKIEKETISQTELRQIQDYIYNLRIKQALIPDWFYEKYRTDYEHDLMSSNNEFIDKFRNNKLS